MCYLVSASSYEKQNIFWQNGCLRHIWCAILLNDIMDPHMSNLCTSVSEGPWCVFYAIRHQIYWGLTHVIFCWYPDMISHTQTHSNTYTQTQHSQGPVDWHTHINTYLHHLLCAHSSYFYYTEWRIHWCQKFTFYNVFSFQKLFTCKIHIYVG